MFLSFALSMFSKKIENFHISLGTIQTSFVQPFDALDILTLQDHNNEHPSICTVNQTVLISADYINCDEIISISTHNNQFNENMICDSFQGNLIAQLDLEQWTIQIINCKLNISEVVFLVHPKIKAISLLTSPLSPEIERKGYYPMSLFLHPQKTINLDLSLFLHNDKATTSQTVSVGLMCSKLRESLSIRGAFVTSSQYMGGYSSLNFHWWLDFCSLTPPTVFLWNLEQLSHSSGESLCNVRSVRHENMTQMYSKHMRKKDKNAGSDLFCIEDFLTNDQPSVEVQLTYITPLFRFPLTLSDGLNDIESKRNGLERSYNFTSGLSEMQLFSAFTLPLFHEFISVSRAAQNLPSSYRNCSSKSVFIKSLSPSPTQIESKEVFKTLIEKAQSFCISSLGFEGLPFKRISFQSLMLQLTLIYSTDPGTQRMWENTLSLFSCVVPLNGLERILALSSKSPLFPRMSTENVQIRMMSLVLAQLEEGVNRFFEARESPFSQEIGPKSLLNRICSRKNQSHVPLLCVCVCGGCRGQLSDSLSESLSGLRALSVGRGDFLLPAVEFIQLRVKQMLQIDTESCSDIDGSYDFKLTTQQCKNSDDDDDDVTDISNKENKYNEKERKRKNEKPSVVISSGGDTLVLVFVSPQQVSAATRLTNHYKRHCAHPTCSLFLKYLVIPVVGSAHTHSAAGRLAEGRPSMRSVLLETRDLIDSLSTAQDVVFVLVGLRALLAFPQPQYTPQTFSTVVRTEVGEVCGPGGNGVVPPVSYGEAVMYRLPSQVVISCSADNTNGNDSGFDGSGVEALVGVGAALAEFIGLLQSQPEYMSADDSQLRHLMRHLVQCLQHRDGSTGARGCGLQREGSLRNVALEVSVDQEKEVFDFSLSDRILSRAQDLLNSSANTSKNQSFFNILGEVGSSRDSPRERSYYTTDCLYEQLLAEALVEGVEENLRQVKKSSFENILDKSTVGKRRHLGVVQQVSDYDFYTADNNLINTDDDDDDDDDDERYLYGGMEMLAVTPALKRDFEVLFEEHRRLLLCRDKSAFTGENVGCKGFEVDSSGRVLGFKEKKLNFPRLRNYFNITLIPSFSFLELKNDLNTSNTRENVSCSVNFTSFKNMFSEISENLSQRRRGFAVCFSVLSALDKLKLSLCPPDPYYSELLFRKIAEIDRFILKFHTHSVSTEELYLISALLLYYTQTQLTHFTHLPSLSSVPSLISQDTAVEDTAVEEYYTKLSLVVRVLLTGLHLELAPFPAALQSLYRSLHSPLYTHPPLIRTENKDKDKDKTKIEIEEVLMGNGYGVPLESGIPNVYSSVHHSRSPYSSGMDCKTLSDHDCRSEEGSVGGGGTGEKGISEKEKVLFLTFASRRSEELDNLLLSAALAGVQVTVLGLQVDNSSGQFEFQYADKLVAYHHHLHRRMDDKNKTSKINATSNDTLDSYEDYVVDEQQVVVLLDAYDVLLFPAAAEAPRFLRGLEMGRDGQGGSGGKRGNPSPVVFCSEHGVYPEFLAPLAYQRSRPWPDRHDSSGGNDSSGYSRAHFLNSGCILGRAGPLRRVLRAVLPWGRVVNDDQQVFVRYHLQHPGAIKLDVEQRFFATAFKTSSTFASYTLNFDLQLTYMNVPIALLHCNNNKSGGLYQYFAAVLRQGFQLYYAGPDGAHLLRAIRLLGTYARLRDKTNDDHYNDEKSGLLEEVGGLLQNPVVQRNRTSKGGNNPLTDQLLELLENHRNSAGNN